MKKVVLAIIKEEKTNKFLLVKSKTDSEEKFRGYWYPPGGYLEKREAPKKTLAREVKEELNLSIKPVELIAQTKGDNKDQVIQWWRCNLLNTKIIFDNEELDDFGYFTREEMKKIPLWPATEKFFEEYIN